MAKLYSYQQQTETPSLRGIQQPRALSGQADVQVPRALAGVADSIRTFGAGMAESEEAQARAWTAQALSKSRLEWAAGLEQRKAKAAPGAAGFTPTLLADFDAYAEEALDAAPTPTARAFYSDRLRELREDLGSKAIGFEAEARVAYQETAYAEGIRNGQLLMNQDPGQYAVTLAEQLALIRASNMGPVKQAEFTKKAVDGISGAAVWSQIQRSPTGFLQSVGLYPDPKTGKVLGDLKGKTGNMAFDAMTFDDRVKYFNLAISERARIDREAEDKIGQRTTKSSDAALRRLYQLIDTDPIEAEKYAIDANRRGELSQEDMKSGWSKARETARQQGPDSEYERSRNYVIGMLDPGPMVSDPVQRGRVTEAIDMFDRWMATPGVKRTDEEIMKRGREIVGQFRMVNLQDTVIALPQPRNGTIRRNPADPAGMLEDIRVSAQSLADRKARGDITQQQYDEDMAILNRWRKAVEGNK